jgi:hypothetical protein
MQYARLAAQTSTSVRLQKNQLGAIAPRLQSACSNVAHHVKLSVGRNPYLKPFMRLTPTSLESLAFLLRFLRMQDIKVPIVEEEALI